MSVFIIIDEWVALSNATGSDPVGYSYFESEDEAHEALRLIAQSYGDDIEADENSYQVPEEKTLPGLEYEEYYIQELTKETS